MHSQARRRVARAGADSALYTSDSDTDTSQKSKFNNSNYLLRICRSPATPFRATPATMQFIIHNDAKLSKLMPAQPLTANGSGGFSSRETHRTQPASRDTTPRVRGLAADPNEAVQPTERRRPQTGSPPQTVANAPGVSTPVDGAWFIGSPGNRTAATFPGARCRPPSSRADHIRAIRGSLPRASASFISQKGYT